ncbi:hypothetical protein B7463_g3388, partial [Scytalidium lignicola]
MYLLHTGTRKLEIFSGGTSPLYAILSHVWGKEEVTFQEIKGGEVDENKEGYKKLRNACIKAASHGFNYIWIDTCCIDKSSSAELSEAINSMYHWYQESGVCYAYLADVLSKDREAEAIPRELGDSSWFRRGWTL